MLEFAKRFKLKEVWKEQPLPGLEGGGLRGRQASGRSRSRRRRWATTRSRRSTRCSSRPTADLAASVAGSDRRGSSQRHRRGLLASSCTRRCGRSTGSSDSATATTWPISTPTTGVRGLRWPVVNGRETQWRYREELRPLREALAKGFNFYGKALKKIPSADPDGREDRSGRARPRSSSGPTRRRRRALTRSTTCGSAPGAYSSTGTRVR